MTRPSTTDRAAIAESATMPAAVTEPPCPPWCTQRAECAKRDTTVSVTNRRAFFIHTGPPRGEGDTAAPVWADHIEGEPIDEPYVFAFGDEKLTAEQARARADALRQATADLVAILHGYLNAEDHVAALLDAAGPFPEPAERPTSLGCPPWCELRDDEAHRQPAWCTGDWSIEHRFTVGYARFRPSDKGLRNGGVVSVSVLVDDYTTLGEPWERSRPYPKASQVEGPMSLDNSLYDTWAVTTLAEMLGFAADFAEQVRPDHAGNETPPVPPGHFPRTLADADAAAARAEREDPTP